MDKGLNIYCCECQKEVTAHLVTGRSIYKTRVDLYELPFWLCPHCGNWVGCHHKSSKPTKPLGCIPTPAIKALRIKIHSKLDPLWKYKSKETRTALYTKISKFLKYELHTADIETVEEAEKILKFIEEELLK